MNHFADLSFCQRNVDYVALCKAVSAAYVKCCDARRVGGLWVPFEDDMHETHVSGVRAQGRPTGDYCFCHPTMDVGELVDFFVAHAFFDQLLLVLDLESLATWADGKQHVPANAGVWGKAAVDRVQAHTGVRPLIYSGKFYAETMLVQCPALAVENWWIAAYPGITTPPDTMPRVSGLDPHHVLAWQWTGTGSLPGIHGNADRDVAPALEPLYAPAVPAAPAQ